MSKRAVSFLCVLAMCLSLLSGISVTAANTYSYTYTMLQNFESADAADDSYTFSQNQPTGNVLTYTNMTNTQMVEVTAGTSLKLGAANLYPRLADNEKDWTGYDGLMFYYSPGDCAQFAKEGNAIGRLEIAFDLPGESVIRYQAKGTVYMLKDGNTEEEELFVGGDGRYALPTRPGYIRVPFTSFRNNDSSWNETVSMSTIKEMYLGIRTTPFAGNKYLFDDIKLYTDGESVSYRVLQDLSLRPLPTTTIPG